MVLALTVLVTVFAYLQKTSCFGPGGYAGEHQYTHACYTDTYALYGNEDLAANPVTGHVGIPYRDHPVEYPPVIGGMMWAAAEVTATVGPKDPNRLFFDLTALGLAACALVSTLTVAKLAGRARVWDAAMMAVSPVLFFHAFTNWDLAAVAVTGLGLWAWSRGSPAAAGLLLGVGVATKLYPVFIVLGLVMLCARALRWRAALTVVAATAVGVVVSYLPAVLISRPFPFPSSTQTCPSAHPLSGWRWFFSLSQIRAADWGSVWLALQHGLGHPLDSGLTCSEAPVRLDALSAAVVLLVIAGTGALVAAAPRRPRVGQVSFLLVAGFIMFNKVDSPQYALWLLPLAILARPRWPALLVWQVTEVVLGVANLYALIAFTPGATDEGISLGTYLWFVLLRDVVLLGLMALVTREMWRPELDVVRRGGVDDPAGGVLVAEPDYAGGGRIAVAGVE